MENKNNRADANQWRNAEHQGDWQISESESADQAEMLTSSDDELTDNRLYATGGNPGDDDSDEESNNDDTDFDEVDDNEDEEAPRDWGHTDPLDGPLPDSNDPSGPGSAV